MLRSRLTRYLTAKVPKRLLISRPQFFLPLVSRGIKWAPSILQDTPSIKPQQRNFASVPYDHPNVLPRIEAGRFEGILNNSAEQVAYTLDKFHDLKWTNLDLDVEAVEFSELMKNTEIKRIYEIAVKLLGIEHGDKVEVRRIQYSKDGENTVAKHYEADLYDIRILPESGPDYQLKHLVYVNNLKYMNQSMTTLLRNSLLVVTQTLHDLGNHQCRYIMRTEVSAPYTSVKLLNIPLDKLNAIYYKGLFNKYNLEDFVLNLDDLPMKISSVSNFLDFQMNHVHGQEKVELYQPRPGIVVAKKMPAAIYGIRYEKLMRIAASFAAVPIEKIYNMFINDAYNATKAVRSMHAGQQPHLEDPWKSMFRATLPPPEEKLNITNEEFLSHDLYGLRLPKYITKDHNYMKDEVFAEYFFNGGNPFSVRKVTDIGKVPNMEEIKQKLKGVDLEDLATKGNLFYLDYSDFKAIQYPEITNNMVGHAPIVLLKRKGSKYLPLGIYVEAPFSGYTKKRVFTPKDPPNVWRLAKMHVNVVDLLFFQIFIHLGQAHLMSEPLAVSIYNNLIARKRGPDGSDKAPNPLGQILAPYARGLLGINHLALITLVDDKQAFIDSVFVGGAAALMKIAKHYLYKNFSLKNMNPRVELGLRGFTQEDLKSKNYGYGYYSVKLYGIIKEYMLKVCRFIYPDDTQVQKDVDLLNLQEELKSVKFNVGFELKSVEDVAEFAANHIWTLTAYHSMAFAVNDYDAYFPFRYSSLTKPLPMEGSKDKEVDNTYVQGSLPFPTKQLVTHVLLSAVGKRMEPSLLGTKNPFNEQTQPELFGYYVEFQDSLEKLEKAYNKHMKRRKKKGRMQFVYLKPSKVENCLSI